MNQVEKKTILIIDDEAVVRRSFSYYLEDLDYTTIMAENGRIGVELFESNAIDLVLTDLRMPEMDGLEVLQRIRESSPETPIIVVSGTGVIGDAVEALRNGAWNYVLKPVEDFSVLGHAVTDSMEKAQLRRENREYQRHLEKLLAEKTEALEDLKRAQERLIQSEKMAALGGLVAGVAHEINTPIGIGVTAASHLEDETNKLLELFESEKLSRGDFKNYISVARESAGMILSNMNRAEALIHSFKQVAVDQSSEEQRQFRMKEYVSEVLASLQPRLRKTEHRIIVNCPEEFIVNSFPGALSQILTNLLMNSLNHGFENIEAGIITIDIVEREGRVIMTYEDSGCGIPEENLKKIFDPFFTTKRGRGGSGLGMHIVYNLATQTLGGTIRCSSRVGEGTRYVLEFPRDLDSYRKE